MFSRTETMKSTSACCDNIARLKQELDTADAVVIGAGSGLSTSAGFTYTGERFQKYFGTLLRSMASAICIQAASIPLTAWKNIGRIGAGISISIAIWTPPKPVYQELLNWCKERTICADHQCGSLFPEGRI